MRDKKYFTKRCQGIAMAGIIGLMARVPAEIAWAIGPGENNYSISESDMMGPGGIDPRNNNTSSIDTNQTVSQENPNAWKRSGDIYLMPDGSSITNVLRRGIDVSRWQGDVDWQQVAADDVSFVMLGTRSRGVIDPYFQKNVQGASAAGIQVGVYIYSTATTPEMAAEEADFILNLIKDYPISYPVALDMEDEVQAALSKEQLAVIANTFCSKISSAGYYPIIYANEYWLNNRLDMSLMNYPVWVARYSQKPTYPSPVMWQATNTGAVKGISTHVDIDFQFSDFSTVIPANTWRTIGGNTYYYANYVQQKNNWIYDGDGWYYMDGQGLALKNWQLLGGERYYLDEISGKMQYGWRMDNGAWYYLGSSGAVAKGWINDNGTWYFGDRSTGAMQTGWLNDGGQTYYLSDSGQMATGWVIPDGKWRYMNGSGILSKGWIYDGSNWYYMDQNGVMQTGWLDDRGQKYFLKENGTIATGWRPIEEAWYYFDNQGHMMTDWQFIDNSWYYLNNTGQMATGLIEVGGVQYYLNPDTGRMEADTTLTINDTTYIADASGRLHVAGLEDGV